MVEANVNKDKWELLKQNYRAETVPLPSMVKQTFLIQSQSQPKTWRIVTHWRSQADLDQMRATTKVPVAVRVFKSVGATPQLAIWDAQVHQLGPELR